MRVSRTFFRVVMPLVWNNVKNIRKLLKLIPGVSIPKSYTHEIAFPCLASADLTRFTIYASHIQSLEVDDIKFPWDSLMLQSQQQPLLPRLLRLTIDCDDTQGSDRIVAAIMWISIFLTGTSTSVRMRGWDMLGHPGIISPLELSALLQAIVQACPQVSELTLPTVLNDTKNEDAEHCLLNLLSTRPAFQLLVKLSNLRELTIGLWVFRPEFIDAIGRLPHLVRLNVPSSYRDVASLQPASLDKALFPALEALFLDMISFADAMIPLRHPVLVQGLVSFKLFVYDDSGDELGIFLALQGMPSLAHLDMEFGTPEEFDMNNTDVLDVLAQIPLRFVRLVRVKFSDVRAIRLEKVFPSVVDLEMPNQLAGLAELTSYAAIPNLKRLVIDFCHDDTRGLSFGVNSVCVSLNTLEWAYQRDTKRVCPTSCVHTIARSILNVFPNTKRIDIHKTYPTTEERQSLALLNTHITIIREWNNARARIAERYGWEEANHFLPDESGLSKLFG
ncbi:hypothetical protein FRC08_007194 [Ceratobasidium sp. 394]|nr:hypothetical protein FRC08_007194 [Ceratobasidium sp. 394]KAG9098105.1 hypothetical protein FS749_004689 [Ceratobasidium sp. UAMH 11750]